MIPANAGAALAVSLMVTAAATAEVSTPGVGAAEASGHPLAWMMGCWQTASGETREVWHLPADNLAIGYGVKLRDGRASFFEQMRMEERNGVWVFAAAPRGRTAVEFRLAELAPGRLVVENLYHDFPQRITYQASADGMTADASRIDGSGTQSWAYGPCPSGDGHP